MKPAIPLIAILVLALYTLFKGIEIPRKSALSTSEFASDSFSKVEFINNITPYDNNKDTLLILSSVGSNQSYGKGREIKDLLETIHSFKFDFHQANLGLLIGDAREYEVVKDFFSSRYYNDLAQDPINHFHKVTLLKAPFIEESFNKIDRNDRHNDNLQRLRRRTIARGRNFVLNNCLDVEKYTLFIDSDIVKIHNPDMIQRFIASRRDIVVPRIKRGGNPDYDKNSWRGQRTTPNEKQLEQMDKNEWDHWDYVPRDVDGAMYHFQTFVDETRTEKNELQSSLDYNFELDSVGGAILFAKSIIYSQGIQFPPNYIIGTTWDRLEGYDGIETEGLCYTAKSCGYSCYGFPNLLAEHSLE